MSFSAKESPENDSVNHPSHYTQGDIECIDAIEASMSSEEFRGYLKGQIIKYIWRYEDKENPLEDLDKDNWYLTKLREKITESTEKEKNNAV